MAASCHIDPAVLHNLTLGVSGSLRKNFFFQRLGSVIFCFFQASINICPRCRLPPHWVMPSCSRRLSQLRALLHPRQGRHSKAKGQPLAFSKMLNIHVFWVLNIFFLATQVHTYGFFHVRCRISKIKPFTPTFTCRINTSHLYEWKRYFPFSRKMFWLSVCIHKNSCSQSGHNFLAMNRKSEFELVFVRNCIFWHCYFGLSDRKVLKNLSPEFPHSWNNCHVLFLRFQRHWCGSALNLS